MHGDNPREPWAFGERAVAVVQKFLDLRIRLAPYFYSATHEAARDGLPVLRALPLAFPDDPNVCDRDFEYLVEPMLLVAPVFEKSNVRNVYIPAGIWIDWWTGEAVRGPKTMNVHAPIETLPLFVRGGGILPMLDEVPANPDAAAGAVTIHVFP